MSLLKADRCTLFLVDKEKQELWFHADEREGAPRITIPITQGIAGHVASGPKQLTSTLTEATRIGRYYSSDFMSSISKRICRGLRESVPVRVT